MSSKKRRTQKESKDSARSDATDSKDDASSPEKSRQEKKTTRARSGGSRTAKGAKGAKSGKPAKKSSLPAFGFADDLLKKSDARGEAAGDDEAAREEKAVAEETAAAVADIDESDPERLFSFADQLQSRQDDREKDQGPEARWETWVTFSLDDETFALPVEPVRQVVRVSSITRVPHAPRPVRGVTNLRGRVIPVIDLRMRVGLEPSPIQRQSRVVAVASRGRILGLLVDAVHQVVHLDLNKVQPPPEDVMTVQSDYILGVYHQEDSLILLLDVDRALVLRDEAA